MSTACAKVWRRRSAEAFCRQRGEHRNWPGPGMVAQLLWAPVEPRNLFPVSSTAAPAMHSAPAACTCVSVVGCPSCQNSLCLGIGGAGSAGKLMPPLIPLWVQPLPNDCQGKGNRDSSSPLPLPCLRTHLAGIPVLGLLLFPIQHPAWLWCFLYLASFPSLPSIPLGSGVSWGHSLISHFHTNPVSGPASESHLQQPLPLRTPFTPG